MQFAGFWRRFAAYWLDALPITLIVVLVFYFFLGFDATLERYWSRGRGDVEARWEFLMARNRIRNTSMALYLAYCGLMEASALRGTLGKRLMGIEVVRGDGSPLTYVQAAKRNSAKAECHQAKERKLFVRIDLRRSSLVSYQARYQGLQTL
jgi:uncharacterized RDD family membrane protein YckC